MIAPDLPLVELHRHLDGSIRLSTILDLGLQHNLPLPARTLEGLRPYVQVSTPQPGVMAFIEKFEWMTGVLVNYDACRRVAYENVEDAFKEGIDYIELRYSPWFMAEAHHLRPEGVVEAVTDGIRAVSVILRSRSTSWESFRGIMDPLSPCANWMLNCAMHQSLLASTWQEMKLIFRASGTRNISKKRVTLAGM